MTATQGGGGEQGPRSAALGEGGQVPRSVAAALGGGDHGPQMRLWEKVSSILDCDTGQGERRQGP